MAAKTQSVNHNTGVALEPGPDRRIPAGMGSMFG